MAEDDKKPSRREMRRRQKEKHREASRRAQEAGAQYERSRRPEDMDEAMRRGAEAHRARPLYAKGGKVCRGAGAATRGTKFSGVF